MPAANRPVIAISRVRTAGPAPANSRQANKPQSALTTTAPCPIPKLIAGPTACFSGDTEATKLQTAPTHHTAPPSIPNKCWRIVPDKYAAGFTGDPCTGKFMKYRLNTNVDKNTPIANIAADV